MRLNSSCGALVGVVVTVVAGLASAGPSLAARVHGGLDRRLSDSTSSNWSGYAVTGGTYTSAASSWTVPTLACTQSPNTYSSFWVGLDGDTTNTVEQTGIEADCSGTTPVYSGWYEMYPKFPVTYTDPVRAGDAMSAYVNYVGNGYFTLYLHDQTQGWSQTVTQLLKKARRGSAEVITEAPWSGGVLPLADFQTVNYAAASANGAYLTASTTGVDAITMVNGGGQSKDTTSPLSGNGDFSNTWVQSS
jgi:hypothetical protein